MRKDNYDYYKIYFVGDLEFYHVQSKNLKSLTHHSLHHSLPLQ